MKRWLVAAALLLALTVGVMYWQGQQLAVLHFGSQPVPELTAPP